jgi:predicted ArsR family transcriptional regulator
MNMQTDSADMRFLRQLRRLGPSSIQQLCEALGVTATAIRQRIFRLQDAGYVGRELIRAERGRPYHVYHVTPEGVRQFGDDYGELAQVLWKELRAIEDSPTRDRLLGRIRESLVERYRFDGQTEKGYEENEGAERLIDRFEQLWAVLDREGFEVEVSTRDGDDGPLPVLREHFCPYHDLAAQDRSMCELEQSVFGEVLGVRLSLSRCCHDGDNYCEFEPDLEPSN